MEKSRSIPIGSPYRISSPSGLSAELNPNGSIRRMDCGGIMLNMFLGNESEGGPANLYLRRLGDVVESTPLLGPLSPACYQCHERGMSAVGQWGDIRFRVELQLAESEKAWFWHVELENTGTNPVSMDLIHTQDLAIADYGAIRLNEFYVSQYVDHCALDHPKSGKVVASRQNQKMGGRFPWTLIGSLGKGISYATDALQFHGFARREADMLPGLEKGLPGQRLQHEHSMVCIQDEPVELEPGGRSWSGFFGWFEPDKPTATEAEDVRFVDSALALPEAAMRVVDETGGARLSPGLFAKARLLEPIELEENELNRYFGEGRRHPEYEEGRLWSFFSDRGGHVVLAGKERGVLRPHGHLLRSGGGWVADESSMASTAWMGGVFHSMVTQGHVSINRFLSTGHSYLGLFRSHGLRVFAEIGGEWQLLQMPSAFEMELGSCRWIYHHAGGVIEVTSSARTDRHELGLSLSVLEGQPCRFLISMHVALNGDDGSSSIPACWERKGSGVFVRAIPESDVGRRFPDGGFYVGFGKDVGIETVGGDELLFPDQVSRNQPYLCLVTESRSRVELSLEGRLIETSGKVDGSFWDTISSGLRIGVPVGMEIPESAYRLGEIFPWLIHNALVHYLSPRGLEQYSGGGWGTRDVCQGPVELLLALGRFAPVRDLLLRVFRQQNADGDWPQWFMFFERERNIRPGDSHGDIVYWPLLALAEYVSATGDKDVLDEILPFFHPDGEQAAEQATVRQHVDRALELIRRRVIHGTVLAAYGHGDWNDSLQPAKPEMRERLCSSWTVTLNYQTLRALAQAFDSINESDSAGIFMAMAESILGEFQRTLMVDEVLAGLAYFHEDGKTEYLLHPDDRKTGLSYSLLPMIHAIINDMFSVEQAEAHLSLIRTHLLGPDSARLFDRPMEYHGGIQRYFQRAESASYFGREIGIMYTHAHLRFCECLARLGKADAFFHALCQMNPILIREVVPSAAPRQANCYYSSSDAAFADRYLAFADYAKVNRGEVPLEGGWRVYSSGAGISVRLILQCFLGVKIGSSYLVIDPVMPPELDGMNVELVLAGHAIKIRYHVSKNGCGPQSVELNGTALGFQREANPYRCGGVRIPLEQFEAGLGGVDDQLTVWLD